MVLTLTYHLSYLNSAEKERMLHSTSLRDTNREVIAITIQELAP
jgi:hypothetical protein